MQFVVIGNGIAGISAAHTIRRLNKEASITVISKEPHPLYSACVLPNYLSGELNRERVFIREFSDYTRENIQLLLAQKAISLDIRGRKVISKSESITYDRLIIATGSEPVVPPIKGTDKKGVFTFKSLEDADMISGWSGEKAVVVGSGPIGVEACLALGIRGYRVYLVERLNWILPQVFDEYPAAIIMDILQSGGIEVSTQERVVEILGSDRVEGVFTEHRKIECDTVILATGMKPEVGLVEGELEIGKLGGVLVDDKMCSSVPGVYACGDCVETKNQIDSQQVLSLLWHNARQQGEVAGFNAAGVPRIYPGSLNITGVELFSIQAVSVGNTGIVAEDGVEVIERKNDKRYQRLILSRGVLVGAQSINWSDNMGVLLSAILKKEKIKNSKDLFSWGKSPFAIRRRFPFGRKLTQI